MVTADFILGIVALVTGITSLLRQYRLTRRLRRLEEWVIVHDRVSEGDANGAGT